MRLVEGGVFNTEALKYSVRRLNQLGYFKKLEAGARRHRRAEDARREEPGRRHAEARGAEPQPAHLRRRRVAVRRLLRPALVPDLELPGPRRIAHAVAAGRARAPRTTRSRSPSRSCSTATSPAASTSTSAPCSTSTSSRRSRPAATSLFGFPVAGFSRMFLTYSYEARKVSDLNEAFFDPNCVLREPAAATSRSTTVAADPDALELLRSNPFLRDSLLIGQGGERTISKVTPSFVYNTVDNPIFPNTGRRLTAVDRLRRPRRQHQLHQAARRSGRVLPPHHAHVGRLPRPGRIHPAVRWHRGRCRSSSACSSAASTASAASTSARSARATSDHQPRPRRQQEPAVQRRVPDHHRRAGAPGAVLRRRPGPRHRREVRLEGRHHRARRPPPPPLLFDPFATTRLTVRPGTACRSQRRRVIGETSAFKTSTGAEIRFFMPVLNVPFRLIFAYNPQRVGVLDNNLQPAKSSRSGSPWDPRSEHARSTSRHPRRPRRHGPITMLD